MITAIAIVSALTAVAFVAIMCSPPLTPDERRDLLKGGCGHSVDDVGDAAGNLARVLAVAVVVALLVALLR